MRLAFSYIFSSTLALLLASTAVIAAPQPYLTVYGEPAKYPAGFHHFDYVNPNAPKGGNLKRSAIEIGRFDHVLPYIDKGIGVSQVDGWLYSPLAQRSLDEPYTVYGLVDLMETASRSLGRIRGDAVLMYGAHDEIVKRGPMRLALERALADGGALKTAWYPNGWHLLNRDLDAEIVYRDVAAWLRNPDAALPSGAPAVLPELEKPAAPDGRAASRR